MSTKLGSKNIILPYSKAYLGSDLVYLKSGGYEDIEFTSCPFPTSWTEVVEGTQYKSTNDYGDWKIYADNYNGAYHGVYAAFDSDFTSYWKSNSRSNTVSYEMGIDLPENIFIKPKSIEIIISQGVINILGYNSTTDSWQTLGNISNSNALKETTYTINVDSDVFYNKFKLICSKYGSGAIINNFNSVYQFRIISGTLRKEN